MKKLRRVFLAATLASGLAMTTSVTLANNYPSEVIKLIVPYSPGGGTDSFARLAAAELEKILKTTIVVENKPGANTAIGTQLVEQSAPNGYTLLFTTDSTAVANPLLYPNLNYSPDDLVPVGTLNEVALGIVVKDDLPVKTFDELVAYTQKNKGSLSYGSYGLGSQAHMMGEAYNKLFATDLVHIPYKGSAPAVVDVMGGRVLFTFPALVTVKGNLEAGKVRMLAVTSSERLSNLPDVPTFKELGHGDMSVGAWYGFFAPKGTPANVVDTFNAALATLLGNPEFVKQLNDRGAIPLKTTPAQMKALIEKDRVFIKKIIDMTNLQVN